MWSWAPRVTGAHQKVKMAEPRSVVITGASRGLGFASAAHLYRQGWRVVAAMRSVDAGMERLRKVTGATDNDLRLIGVPLDLTDTASVTAAAKSIEEAVGAPYGLVHNAGISAAGMVEETPVRADQGAAAIHAQGGAGPHRVGVQSGRGPWDAGDRTVFCRQRRTRALG
jgi:NAD(P)-dependent dehydrogenase (short-subunit alcohol dehydrogenase family)